MKKIIWSVGVVLLAVALGSPAPAAAQGVLFVNNNMVGVLNETPAFPLDLLGNLRVRRTDGVTSNIRFQVSGGAVSQTWLFQNNSNTGNFEIRDVTGGASPMTVESGAPANLLRLTSSGTVEILGDQVNPDYVFEPFYDLETIAEHAEYMFRNKHLPAVGPGHYNEKGEPVILLGRRSQGMLEELEKAHIYIAHLDRDLEAARQQNEDLTKRLERLEGLIANNP